VKLLLNNETDKILSKENETVIEKLEMLTIKECAELISRLSEHTIRQLVKHGKVKSIRICKRNYNNSSCPYMIDITMDRSYYHFLVINREAYFSQHQ